MTMQTVLELLTGDAIVDSLASVMAENFEDFADVQSRYQKAIHALQKALGSDTTPSVQEEMAAIRRQTASDLFFSGSLGLKANLDHFIDPIAKNFLDVDHETYLREATAHRLPEYVRAQQVRDRFYALLSPEQQELYEDVVDYVSYLETVGPKLAHYCGYILGNTLLYQLVPGYHPDPVLTERYRTTFENYWGKHFLLGGS